MVLYDPVSMQFLFLFGFLSFSSLGSISCFQNCHANTNFKMKKNINENLRIGVILMLTNIGQQ